MWASARSTVICNTGDKLASETHTNKIINAGSITHKITYTKTGSRLQQVMLEFWINNLDINNRYKENPAGK